ncbi:uncharacterized protein N7484_008730 [Penicillium longicatenatum]|uniref:uncharacterized protein n=1 Tax=Penicillium longicatenatum TaxID=1561947 RepID=UPI00254782B3|nr:uncharacterized protein N7484_008730 [Penicillium longicatenatum]KAJ5635417.1 hypothetical protein N7484_008730 [Penicillium longicatenatum]
MTLPPRATFEPFPTDLNVKDLVETTDQFEFARRISCDAIDILPLEEFDKLVRYHVTMLGMPLVIEGFYKHLDKRLFSSKWLQKNGQSEQVRDLVRGINIPMGTSHYLRSLHTMSKPIFSPVPRTDQRLYLKDIDCPPEWQISLERLIPPSLFYLNNGPKPYEGPGSHMTNLPEHLTTSEGETIAKSGDLMSCLPEEMRAQNLMCYIGPEGTYTPAHQEMCASLGHNIMVEASDGSIESGQPTQPGSSVWFMTETKERDLVSDYWASVLGHNIDLEDHFAQLNAWIGAPFKTYVVEQRAGDLILVPPLAAHQVWNRGTRTMKVAWNRTTVETLRMAMSEALPHARMVCRDEQYKNKAIVFYALERYSKLLQQAPKADHPATQQLWEDFKQLFKIFTGILLSESLSPALPGEKGIEYVKFDSNVTCSYCRCNIFNRFLTCSTCTMDGNDAYDICLDCYVLGRSCHCISKLKWVEQFPWKHLRDRHETWRRQIIDLKADNKDLKTSFPVFAFARSQLKRKTVAEICQEQLAVRPWVDPNNPTAKKMKSISPPATDDDGRPKKKRKTQQRGAETGSCHMCRNIEPSWKLAACSSCHLKYCYAILYRAFDIPPQEAMERSKWLCPRCQKVCNCTPCQKDPAMKPHEPYHIILGHDTRKIADPRSVESLVTLRLPNLKWLPSLEENSQRRLKQRMDEVQQNGVRMRKDNAIVMDPRLQDPLNGNTEHSPGYIPVDPALELENGSFVNDQNTLEA